MGCREDVLAAAASLMARSGGAPFSPADVVAELGRSGYAEQTLRTHVVSHMSSGQDSPLVRVDRGLYVLRGPTTSQSTDPTTSTRGMATEPERAWPWEGAVQAQGERRLGAEVKGWPSSGYADPRRAAEVKRTQPTTQAGHWYAQALMKAVMLRDSHPDHESLIVLPDHPRYRDLTDQTKSGRRALKCTLMTPALGWRV